MTQRVAYFQIARQVPAGLHTRGEFFVVPVFPRVAGVYCLIDGGHVLYVGESVDVVGRVKDHAEPGSPSIDPKHFALALFQPTDGSVRERRARERELIAALDPPYNRDRFLWNLGAAAVRA